MASVLQNVFADKVDKGDNFGKKMYNCEICGRSFKHPGNFKQHMSSHLRMTTQGGPPMR